MRRKTIKLLAAVIAVFTICIGLSGCALGGNREPNYRLDIAKEFGIMIPEEWKTVYYNSGSLGGWHGDGVAYYVFEVSERDEEFFSEFSQTKDEAFESDVVWEKEQNFDKYPSSDPIDPEYLFDFNEPYEWYYEKVNLSRIRMIYQLNRLYVFASYI